ncbi:MAG: NAD(P)/FAD-dependent oxidoreductase [Acidimicrobiales bacterium]
MTVTDTRSPATGLGSRDTGGGDAETVDTLIVGTGFAGIGAAVRLLQSKRTDFVVLERASDVGGTWRDNTYPGCRCDVPSHLYSFSFAPNPYWSETFSPQPEIFAYLRKVATDFGVIPHIRWNHEVSDATWSPEDERWIVTTSGGRFRAKFLILGTGALVEPLIPDLPGLGDFEGKVMHSARWDNAYDLTGKRVAVIGTGASSIQIVPSIQPQVRELTLFQRTPAWIVPHPGRSVRRWEQRLFAALPVSQRLARAGVYFSRELAVLAFVKYPKLMKAGAKQAAKHLESQVPDVELRRKLTPHYEMGCKRVLPSNEFYPALSKPNVHLVTEAVTGVDRTGVVTADGMHHDVDVVVFGTGFHVTDNPMAQLVHGRDGHTLSEIYEGDLSAYLGTSIPYFPNMVMMTGPNTGLGHSSMVFMIESQLNYVLEGRRQLEAAGMDVYEVKEEVADRYSGDLQRALPDTVWGSGCSSWYLDKTGRNITLWPDFTFIFRKRSRKFEPNEHVIRKTKTRVNA